MYNKILLKLLFVFILQILLAFPSFAQKRVLTIDDAISLALQNNRDVKIAEMNVQKANAAVHEAFGYALPSLDVSATYNRFLKKPMMIFPDFESLLSSAAYGILVKEKLLEKRDDMFKPIGYKLQSFSLTNNFSSSVQLSQILFNSAVFRGIGASQIYLDLSQEELKRAVSNAVLEVRKTFYGVLLAKELYNITEASLNNASQNLGNVKALNQQGLVAEFDFLQAQVRVENIRPVLLQMENTLSAAKDGLKIILNIDQTEDLDFQGEFNYDDQPLPDENESVAAALTDNFSIKSMQMKLKVDEAFIDLDRADYWPSIVAFGNVSYAGSSDNFKFQTYDAATVGLSFSINLFRGTRTYNAVEQSELTLSQSQEQFTQLKDFVVSQVKFRIKELRKVKASLEAQERNVKIAERAYELATLRYKEGTGSQLEVENSDIALRQAKINRLQSVYDYIIANSNLEQLLGIVNPDYLTKYDFNE